MKVWILGVASLAGYSGGKAWMAYMGSSASFDWWAGLVLVLVVLGSAVGNLIISPKRTILSIASGIGCILAGGVGYAIATL